MLKCSNSFINLRKSKLMILKGTWRLSDNKINIFIENILNDL
jgi:hypothetical protein